MKARFAFVLVLFLFLKVCENQAQEATRPSSPIKSGGMAVSISARNLAVNTNWSSVRNAAFTAKYHTSEKQALRFLLLFQGVPGHEEWATEVSLAHTSRISPTGCSQLGIEYLWYPRITKEVRFFLGGGPALAVSYRDDGKKHSLFKQYTYGLMASSTCGLEYFIRNNLSFMAEYALSFQWAMKYYNEDWIYTSEGTFIGYDYRSFASTFIDSFTRFGISFYF